METILTAEQAKTARDALHLSQGKVASEVGINRTYLSLFESGKYVFEDDTLSALRSYFEEQGHDFDTPNDQAATSKPQGSVAATRAVLAVRVKDGFVVPSALAEDEAEKLLTEYQENRRQIVALCGEQPNEGFFFSDVDENDLQRRQQAVMQLMARNYALVERLHGHTPLGEQDEGGRKKTVGQHLDGLFQALFEGATKKAEKQPVNTDL